MYRLCFKNTRSIHCFYFICCIHCNVISVCNKAAHCLRCILIFVHYVLVNLLMFSLYCSVEYC